MWTKAILCYNHEEARQLFDDRCRELNSDNDIFHVDRQRLIICFTICIDGFFTEYMERFLTLDNSFKILGIDYWEFEKGSSRVYEHPNFKRAVEYIAKKCLSHYSKREI